MANPKVRFIETSSSKLSSLPIVEGTLIFTTDTFQLYRDGADTRYLLTRGNKIEVSSSEPADSLTGDIWMVLSSSEKSE